MGVRVPGLIHTLNRKCQMRIMEFSVSGFEELQYEVGSAARPVGEKYLVRAVACFKKINMGRLFGFV